MVKASELIAWLKQQLGRDYDDVNCSQLLVEGIRECGSGEECKTYRCGGTNELWRSHTASGKYCYITCRMTLQAAKDNGCLVPGVILAIWEDGYNAKYHDGEGNCDHIGIYVGEAGCEVIHSSATMEMVAKSTLKNGWTHVLIHRLIELDDADTIEPLEGLPMVVHTNEGDPLTIREKPTARSKSLGSVKDGGEVMVIGAVRVDEMEREWLPVRVTPQNRRTQVTGWMCAQYLIIDESTPQTSARRLEGADADYAAATVTDCAAVPRAALLALADAINELDDTLGPSAYIAALEGVATRAKAVAAYLKGDD